MVEAWSGESLFCALFKAETNQSTPSIIKSVKPFETHGAEFLLQLGSSFCLDANDFTQDHQPQSDSIVQFDWPVYQHLDSSPRREDAISKE